MNWFYLIYLWELFFQMCIVIFASTISLLSHLGIRVHVYTLCIYTYKEAFKGLCECCGVNHNRSRSAYFYHFKGPNLCTFWFRSLGPLFQFKQCLQYSLAIYANVLFMLLGWRKTEKVTIIFKRHCIFVWNSYLNYLLIHVRVSVGHW